MLKLSSLTKNYDGKKLAVDSIDLSVNHGEIFGFIGPNGAGKTTTIKMITGMLLPTSGQVLIDNVDISKEPVKAKNKFTFVPDHPEIFDSISGFDYLNFIGDIYGINQDIRQQRIEKYAKTFEIYDSLGKAVSSYSHGMKQKLLISGALLPNPKLFILDEPLVGLDPRSARILKDIMREHCQTGGTVFFSSHVLEVVENLCDRIAIIKDGKIIALGTIDQIKDQDESLEEMFLELTENE
ncbi:ABC transporter ATP-binding protein [Clostridium sp. 'deep sea']|uniref:ABC transporter ATP-binding protein n=1 Tax=Clostridium sp. 'deep sea' TaxID=2779445 RepID=UPI001FACD3F8|nr:ABC transporter ATP-binding protein [Clostridium sp. 'deep sea']